MKFKVLAFAFATILFASLTAQAATAIASCCDSPDCCTGSSCCK
jgi:hypothetical protein